MSRFVSAGTISDPKASDEAWLKAQADIEAKTQAKLAEGQQEGGKSLYEHLQARKAAKQEAFEEAAKLKNQFRALDEDEISFLDAVEERARSKAAAAQRETAQQLEAFRKQQEEAGKTTERTERSGDATDGDVATESWAPSIGKKRRKGKESDMLKGVKIRRTSSSGGTTESKTSIKEHAAVNLPKSTTDGKKSEANPKSSTSTNQTVTQQMAKQGVPKIVGLADYSSDEDE